MSKFETDALNPSSLPSANLGQRRPAYASSSGDPGAAGGDPRSGKGSREGAQLDQWAEELNKRVDKDVKAALEGLKELVEVEAGPLGPVGTASATSGSGGTGGAAAAGVSGATAATEPEPILNALHLKIRTAALIRACQNIRDTAHELKLLLVLGDPVGDAQNRDAEMKRVRGDVGRLREDVASQVAELVLPGSTAKSATAITNTSAAANGDSDAAPTLTDGATAPAASSSPTHIVDIDTPRPEVSSSPTMALEAEPNPSPRTLPAAGRSSSPTLAAEPESSTPPLPTDPDDDGMDIDEDLEEVTM